MKGRSTGATPSEIVGQVLAESRRKLVLGESLPLFQHGHVVVFRSNEGKIGVDLGDSVEYPSLSPDGQLVWREPDRVPEPVRTKVTQLLNQPAST